MSLSYALKYKIETNLLLIGGNVAELCYPNVLLINVPGEVAVHSHPFNSVLLKNLKSYQTIILQFFPKPS